MSLGWAHDKIKTVSIRASGDVMHGSSHEIDAKSRALITISPTANVMRHTKPTYLSRNADVIVSIEACFLVRI